MENIKLFKTHAEYETFAESDSYIEPHVSLCENEVPTDGRKYCVQYNKKQGKRMVTIFSSITVHYTIDGVEYTINSDDVQERQITDSITVLYPRLTSISCFDSYDNFLVGTTCEIMPTTFAVPSDTTNIEFSRLA